MTQAVYNSRHRGFAGWLCHRWLHWAFACGLTAAVWGQPMRAAPPAPPVAPPPARWDPLTDPPQTEVMPVEREYDRFQDKITIKVEGIRPAVTKGESRIFINATTSFDGPEVTGKPEKIALNLMSVAEDFQYVDLREGLQLILLINNSRTRVPARFVKAGTTRDREPKSLESFVAIIDAEVLVGMATAQKVEAQLGASEFKLGTMEQLSLRKFAETVNLVAPLPKAAANALDAAIAADPVRPDAVAVHLAQAKVDEAQEKVDQLTGVCLKKLEKSPQYEAVLKISREFEAKKDNAPPGAERADISQQWLEAKAKVSLMKSSAMLEDADLSTARRALTDAQAALRFLRGKIDRPNLPAAVQH